MKTEINAPLIVRNVKKENLTRKQRKQRDNETKKERINIFYNQCPDHLVKEKKVLSRLNRSYKNFSFASNLLRMVTFFQYHNMLLAPKKRSLIRQYLFCLKMFVATK